MGGVFKFNNNIIIPMNSNYEYNLDYKKINIKKTVEGVDEFSDDYAEGSIESGWNIDLELVEVLESKIDNLKNQEFKNTFNDAVQSIKEAFGKILGTIDFLKIDEANIDSSILKIDDKISIGLNYCKNPYLNRILGFAGIIYTLKDKRLYYYTIFGTNTSIDEFNNEVIPLLKNISIISDKEYQEEVDKYILKDINKKIGALNFNKGKEVKLNGLSVIIPDGTKYKKDKGEEGEKLLVVLDDEDFNSDYINLYIEWQQSVEFPGESKESVEIKIKEELNKNLANNAKKHYSKFKIYERNDMIVHTERLAVELYYTDKFKVNKYDLWIAVDGYLHIVSFALTYESDKEDLDRYKDKVLDFIANIRLIRRNTRQKNNYIEEMYNKTQEEKDEELINLLKKYAIGKENAVYSDEIDELLSYDVTPLSLSNKINKLKKNNETFRDILKTKKIIPYETIRNGQKIFRQREVTAYYWSNSYNSDKLELKQKINIEIDEYEKAKFELFNLKKIKERLYNNRKKLEERKFELGRISFFKFFKKLKIEIDIRELKKIIEIDEYIISNTIKERDNFLRNMLSKHIEKCNKMMDDFLKKYELRKSEENPYNLTYFPLSIEEVAVNYNGNIKFKKLEKILNKSENVAKINIKTYQIKSDCSIEKIDTVGYYCVFPIDLYN